MNLSSLIELIAPGESDRLELKRSTGSLRDAMKTVCALLNSPMGGFVVFGVNDRGNLVGQDVATRTFEDIAHEFAKLEPPAFPDTETIPLDSGLNAIVLRITGGTGLYMYDGRPYHRVGPTTSRMPTQFFERRLLERMHATVRWENRVADGVQIADLDEQEIVRTIDEAIRRQRLDDPGTRDP